MLQSIELTPSWKRWFWGYFFGILLVPFFGIGLFVLWKVHTKKNSFIYEVTNRQIKSVDDKLSKSIDLANVTSIDVEQNWLDQKLGIGDLLLTTESRTLRILGQADPNELSNMIAQAVQAERKRIKELNKVKPQPTEHPAPGSLDRMDYLTGLWQQGLITNEEFEEERKHFEK